VYPLKGDRPQEIGSAITYGRRYALVAVLNLRVAEDDDDAQRAEAEADLTPSQRAQGGARRSAQRTSRPSRPRAAPPAMDEEGGAEERPTPHNPDAPASKAARNKVFAVVKDLGYTVRAEYLEYVNRVLARHQSGPVGSTNDLTQEQAGWV